MKAIKTIVLPIMLSMMAGSIYAGSATLSINDKAVGKNGVDFVKKIDEAIGGYVRALRQASAADFDSLNLVMFMNQTANIEQKLDILIAETRKNNQLLAANLRRIK